MEIKSLEPDVNLLPSDLLNDIEYDEYDKEIEFMPSLTNEDFSPNSMSYYILNKKNYNSNNYFLH